MYQRAYNKQPFLFRNGANDGFHEAIGDSIALAITPAYLKQLGLIDQIPPPEADIPLQLRTALDKIAFLPFGLLIDKWRWQVFSGETKPADYNKAWWALREKYQGVAPPVARSEADFDPGAKYHIPGNVPYARYFLARIYQFQFYKAMCDASGYKGPLNRCTFYGSQSRRRQAQHHAHRRPVPTLADHPQTNDRHRPPRRRPHARILPTPLPLAKTTKRTKQIQTRLENCTISS